MSVPTRTELTNPTLQAIHQAGGSASKNEITELVIRNLNLSEEDANEHHGTGYQTELEYRLGWARTELKKYGLITNSVRGVWSLTPQGQKTPSIDPQVVERANREADRANRETGSGARVLPSIGTDDPADTSEEPWKERLLNALTEMDPGAFERLCQHMLRESGFIEVEVKGGPGDGGIDGHGIVRMGGFISFPVVFQCKRYQGSVTAGDVQRFRGAMEGRGTGLLITTGRFTRDAKAEATRDGVRSIDLIDGDLLAEKLKEIGLGVKTEMVERVTVDAAFFEGI